MIGGGRRAFLAAIVATISLLTACAEKAAHQPEIRVEEAWVRAVAEPDANSAAYMILRNVGSAPDRLTGALSGAARATELHRTTIDADGMARMGKVEAIEIGPGEEARLEPGSYHLMLMGVTRTLAQGDTVRIRLDFEATGALEIAAEVRAF